MMSQYPFRSMDGKISIMKNGSMFEYMILNDTSRLGRGMQIVAIDIKVTSPDSELEESIPRESYFEIPRVLRFRKTGRD